MTSSPITAAMQTLVDTMATGRRKIFRQGAIYSLFYIDSEGKPWGPEPLHRTTVTGLLRRGVLVQVGDTNEYSLSPSATPTAE